MDWIESASQAIEAFLTPSPRVPGVSGRLAERLSALLLERLPPDLALPLFRLLPEGVRREQASLERSALGERDPSIGYMTFVERALLVLGEGSRDEMFYRDLADTFLHSVGQAWPAEIRAGVVAELPFEVRQRMEFQAPAAAA